MFYYTLPYLNKWGISEKGILTDSSKVSANPPNPDPNTIINSGYKLVFDLIYFAAS